MRYSLVITSLAAVVYSFPHSDHECPTGEKKDAQGHCTPFGGPTPTPTECPTGMKLDPNGVCTGFIAPTDICTGGMTFYGSKCVCPPGSKPDGKGGCEPFYPSTPPYDCGHNKTLCATTPTPPNPTEPPVVTTTSIETITFCPKSTSCHGQTVTWTATEGPTSCPPVVTCTCVLPGGPPPTLSTCPPSVTCTGQTTTNTAGVTVVLPSETLNLPPRPTSPSTTTPPLEGVAVKGGVGLVAILLGAIAAL